MREILQSGALAVAKPVDRAAAPVIAASTHAAQQFVAFSVDPFCLADQRGYFVALSEPWEGLLGYTRAELMARPFLEFVHPDEVDETAMMFDTVADGTVITKYANRYRHKDGGYRWLQWSARLLPESGLISASVRDVTEERRRAAHAAEVEHITGVGSWEIDLDTKSLYWSPATYRIHDLEPESYRPVLEDGLSFYPEHVRGALMADVDRMMRDGTPYDRELPFITAKGRHIWVRATGAAETRHGKIVRVYGTIRDVTQERAQRLHLLRLGAVTENTTNPVVICNAEGRVEWVNAAFERLSGYTAAEARDREPGELLQESETDPGIIRAMRGAVTRRAPFKGELINRAKDGRAFWVELEIQPMRDEAGAHSGFIAVLNDITARRQAEEEARRANRQLHSAIEVLADGFVLYDAEDRMVVCNENYRKLYAKSAKVMVPGTTFEEIIRYGLKHGQYAEAEGRQDAWLAERLHAHRAADSMIEQHLADGRWLRIVERKTPDGGRVGLRIDITELKAQQDALETARRKAEAASLAKSSFLANMSHEIRTPMNGVIGMADVLEATVTDPAQRRLVNTIRDSGETLLNIINDILDFSKIEAGKLDLERAPFLPGDLMRRTESLHSLKASEKGISFAIAARGAPDLPRLGDQHRILQILHNLVSNAIKFTETGEVRVTLDCTAGAPFILEIRDTGIGMTRAQVATLFEDFSQADSSITRCFGGTGLGMAIVKSLVDAMAGEISVDSTIGQGTRIRVSLPLPAAPGRMPLPENQAEDLPLPKDLRLLAADDNRTNRMVLDAHLRSFGLVATIVDDGHEAVAAFAAAPYDALLLDISMPMMDGIAALNAIREVERRKGLAETPAIAITANALKHQVRDYLGAGFLGHVAKPLRPKALRHALHLCVERRDGPDRQKRRKTPLANNRPLD